MIFSYIRYLVEGPNGVNIRFRNDDDNSATELATVDGVTYVFFPDDSVIPDQPAEIYWTEVEPTPELMSSIRVASPHIRLINASVVARIRERYSIDDEIKLLRTQPSADFDTWHNYVEECRAWGNFQKAKIGL